MSESTWLFQTREGTAKILSFYERDHQNAQIISNDESPAGKASAAPDRAQPQSDVPGAGRFMPLWLLLVQVLNMQTEEVKEGIFVAFIYFSVCVNFHVLICN